MDEIRKHTTEVEIAATPDQVFRAITEAEQIIRWFAPEVRVEPGPDGKMVGGSYVLSWGGAGSPSTISIWEPGRRFAAFKERSTPYGYEGDAPAETGSLQRLTVDYQIEAIEGGKTRLRLVHSGFGRGAGWDNEFESTRQGWPVFMRILKHSLERHPGVDSKTIYVSVPCAIEPEEAWKRFSLGDRKPGDRYSVRLSSGATLEGVVSEYDPPENFVGVADNLNDALVSLSCGPKSVNAVITLWGPARDRAKEIEAEWTEGLKALIPA